MDWILLALINLFSLLVVIFLQMHVPSPTPTVNELFKHFTENLFRITGLG